MRAVAVTSMGHCAPCRSPSLTGGRFPKAGDTRRPAVRRRIRAEVLRKGEVNKGRVRRQNNAWSVKECSGIIGVIDAYNAQFSP